MQCKSGLIVRFIYSGVNFYLQGSFNKLGEFFPLFGIGLQQKLVYSHKNICFELIQNDGKLNSAFGSFIRYLVAEKCKFTEECVMSMEKRVSAKKKKKKNGYKSA